MNDRSKERADLFSQVKGLMNTASPAELLIIRFLGEILLEVTAWPEDEAAKRVAETKNADSVIAALEELKSEIRSLKTVVATGVSELSSDLRKVASR
ncbi:MAG TPA: hypothetical protein VGN98_01735 [Tianweitania sediminis]|jgi:hypothetical protein|nr:hypothetical protein [Tianweitania sediminis]